MSWAPENIHIDTWPAIHALLAPALKRGDCTVTELIDELLAGTAQLWVLRKGGDPVAAAVSEMDTNPRGPLVRVRLLAGSNMKEWLDGFIECLSRKAREAGAIGLCCEGRAGWQRVLATKGWKFHAVVMALTFEPEAVHG